MSTKQHPPHTAAKRAKRFNAAATASEAQRQKLLTLLRFRPHHTDELREKGIFHAAARIQDLEKRGYVFTSQRVNLIDRDGYPRKGVALYTLIATPEKIGGEQ